MIKVDWTMLGWDASINPAEIKARDLWAHEDISFTHIQKDGIALLVKSHDIMMLKINKRKLVV